MISTLLLRVSTLLLLCGLVFGIDMGMREDFTLAPAHAHLNLIGFVLMFLVGLYYRIVPAAGAGPLATIQACPPYRRRHRAADRRRPGAYRWHRDRRRSSAP